MSDDVEFIRVIGEELVKAGHPAGDRTVILANLRRLLSQYGRLRKAFRINALRWAPELSPRQIDAEIKRIEGL